MSIFAYDPPQRSKRGGGSSEASRSTYHERVLPALRDSQRVVYEIVLRRGSAGTTVKEAAAEMGCGMNVISGRFTELCGDGFVRKDGARRDNAAVYVPVYADAAGQGSLFGEGA